MNIIKKIKLRKEAVKIFNDKEMVAESIKDINDNGGEDLLFEFKKILAEVDGNPELAEMIGVLLSKEGKRFFKIVSEIL